MFVDWLESTKYFTTVCAIEIMSNQVPCESEGTQNSIGG